MADKVDGRKGHSGGARKGAGRKPSSRRRRNLTKPAAVALKLIAWQRVGRPTTEDEEDAVLSALVLEERDRIIV